VLNKESSVPPLHLRFAVSILTCLGILLLILVPTTGSASIQATIQLSKRSGPPGTKLTVRGSGYQANELVDIFEDTLLVKTANADGSGDFSALIKIRRVFGPGPLPIQAVGESSGFSAEAMFTIHTNWSQFHFDPAHSGSNPFENLIFPSNVSLLVHRWTGQMTGQSFGLGPVQVNGIVYDGWSDGLYAFREAGCDPQSVCQPLWKAPTSSPIYTHPAVAGATVFAGAGDGRLHAFDASTGAALWDAAVSAGPVPSSPSVAGGTLYVGSDDNQLYAFATNGCGQPTCSPLWTGLTGGVIRGSPAIAGGTVFATSLDGNLSAFSAAGCGQSVCAPLWSGATGDAIGSSPSVAGGVAYVTSMDGKLYAFDAAGCGQATCAPLWTGDTGIPFIGTSPAVGTGSVYVGTDFGLFVFPSAGCGEQTCSPLWTAPTSGPITYSPAAANGVLYLSEDYLDAFDASGCGAPTCSPLAKFDALPGSDLVITDGMVFINGDNGAGVTAFGFPPLHPSSRGRGS
jgi:hypothetical protein